MREVVIFNHLNALDFHEIRDKVIRIPEVSIRIREAQNVWDVIGQTHFSFFNHLVSDDRTYMSNIKIKSLVTSIVQVGLFDRYVWRFGRPDFVVGSVNADSPLKVCVAEVTLEDMILESPVLKPSADNKEKSPHALTVLTGISLAELGLYKQGDKSGIYEPMKMEKLDLGKILNYLIEEGQVKKLINVGPGMTDLDPLQHNLSMRDLQIIESIDADPMLSWFWTEMRRSNEVINLAQ